MPELPDLTVYLESLEARLANRRLEVESGTLAVTEAGTKRRASLHVVQGEKALAAMDPGGVEIFDIDEKQFGEQLRKENHTLKRALADASLFAGIGNAYSDEILHRAQLSPVALTSKLNEEEIALLYRATRPTTARAARRAASGSPTDRSPACSRRAGRDRSKNENA